MHCKQWMHECKHELPLCSKRTVNSKREGHIPFRESSSDGWIGRLDGKELTRPECFPSFVASTFRSVLNMRLL